MKYIKKFEDVESILAQLKHKIGDYVLLKFYDPIAEVPAKIINITNDEFAINILKMNDLYEVEALVYRYDEEEELCEFSVSDKDISRKLTPEEIEDFETKKDALNYNL